jgi:hypothetical protein
MASKAANAKTEFMRHTLLNPPPPRKAMDLHKALRYLFTTTEVSVWIQQLSTPVLI